MPDPFVMMRAMAAAAVIAAIFVAALGWPWRAPGPARMAMGWALGIGVAVFVGSYALGWKLHWPPTENRERFLFILLPAAVVIELVAAFRYVPRPLAWLLRALVAGAAAPVLLHESAYLVGTPGPDSLTWTPDEKTTHLAVLGGALLIVWALMAFLLHRSPTRSVPLALSLVSVASAVSVMFEASAANGQMGFPLAGALAGAAAASLLLAMPPTGAAPISIGLVSLFALLIDGRFFADLTTLHAVVLLGAPLLCWVSELPGLRKTNVWIRGALRIALVIAPLIFVVWEAQRPNENKPQPSGQDDEWEKYYKSL
jgi:hypothetical protein